MLPNVDDLADRLQYGRRFFEECFIMKFNGLQLINTQEGLFFKLWSLPRISRTTPVGPCVSDLHLYRGKDATCHPGYNVPRARATLLQGTTAGS